MDLVCVCVSLCLSLRACVSVCLCVGARAAHIMPTRVYVYVWYHNECVFVWFLCGLVRYEETCVGG